MTHIMVDLETFSLDSNASIISIGAVKFDPAGEVDIDSPKFEVAIEPKSSERYGFHVDMGTVMWWMHSDRNAARDPWMAQPKVAIDEALIGLMTWMNPASPTDIQVWGNGAAFDNVILRNAFTRVTGAGTCPWSYRMDRCYKTLREMSRGKVDEPTESYGVFHSALADAMWQARHLQSIFQTLGLPIP